MVGTAWDNEYMLRRIEHYSRYIIDIEPDYKQPELSDCGLIEWNDGDADS